MVFNPTQADSIAQTSRKVLLVFTVGIHLQDTRAHLFLFFTGIATAADRYVDLAVAANRDSARQMPAAILVVQAVVRKSCQYFRLPAWLVFPGSVFVAQQMIREGQVEPVDTKLISIESNAVRITQALKIRSYLFEGSTDRVKLLEYVDDTF